MKKLLFLSFLVLFLAGCDDDPEEDDPEVYVNGDTSPKYVRGKGMASHNGLIFNMDSVVRCVIIKYNEQPITDMAAKILDGTLRKHRVLEYKNGFSKKYGYELNSEVMQALARYNFSRADMGAIGEKKAITLIGSSPYKEKDIWESMAVIMHDVSTKHPVLYAEAIDSFYKVAFPKVTDILVESQAANTIEYNAKITYLSGNEQYVHFKVTVNNDQTIVEVGSPHTTDEE